MPELAQAEKNVFGDEAAYHPITLMPLERGVGALSADQQAELHCVVIEHRHGKAAAEAMRRKLADAARLSADMKTAAADGVKIGEVSK